MTRWLLHTALVGTGMAITAGPASAQQAGRVSFSKDVLPIFQKRCQNCHGVGDRGGLKLDTLDNVLQGGAKGEIIIRGNPDQSRLMQYIDGRLTPRMPQGGTPLSRVEMATIGAWIQQGAQSDDGANPGMAAKPLELAEPKDGSDVKEKVKLVVPKEGIPNGGFIAIYIDDRFRVALAPPSADDLEEQGKPADSPLAYTWDTKGALTDDSNALAQERYLQDGPHVVEIRSYDANGTEIERVKAQVNLRNRLDSPTNKPVRLVYGGDGNSSLGKQWIMEHSVDFEANAAAAGFGRAARGGAAAQQTAAGPDKIKHKELTKYLVSLEDIIPASGVGFYRERREGPIVVFLDNTKHVVRVDASSRYYSMERTGQVSKTKLMERESREPIVNPLDLPGRAHRMNEPFTTNLRVHLGSYIPAALSVERLQATLEGMEWQNGEQCARIRLTYVSGSNKVDINSVNIKNADFQIVQGNSTIWFSETTGRVVRAKHEITGNLMVDSSQFAAGAGGGLGMGAEGIPGESGSPYGGSPYGAPGMGAMPGGYPMAGGGSPYGAPGMGTMPGGYGAPAFGGSAPGGYGGSPYGAPAGSPYGATSEGGSPYGGAPGMGGGTGLPGPKLKRYHVTLKVNTQLAAEDEPGK